MLRSHFLASAGATAVAQLNSPATTTTFGVVAPFSGPDIRLGERLADGVRAAIDDTNRLRGSLDRIYALRTFDDNNTVANAMVNAQFATGDGSIVAVIGHLASRTTVAAIPTYAAAQMALIVPVSTDDRVTATNYHNVFRLQTKDASEGALFARYVIDRYHPKTVLTFVQNGDYGGDVADAFVREIEARKIAAPLTQFTWDKPDFEKVVDGALVAKPDFVFLPGFVRDMGGIVPVLRAKGYSGPIGASQGFFDAATMALGPAANELVISTSTPYLPLAPSAVRTKADFESRYGPLQPIALFGYAAAQIAIATVQRSGANARNAFLRALAQSLPIDTVAGRFGFDPNGDPLDPELYFYAIRDGKFAYVRQAHPSSFMIK